MDIIIGKEIIIIVLIIIIIVICLIAFDEDHKKIIERENIIDNLNNINTIIKSESCLGCE